MTALPIAPDEVVRRRDRGAALEREGNLRGLPVKRLALLSSFNTDFLKPFLQEALERSGVYATIELGQFAQLTQLVSDVTSELYVSQPDSVILVPAAEDYLAALFARPARFSAEQADRFVDERLAELRQNVHTLLEQLPAATCYVVTFASAGVPLDHLLDASSHLRGQRIVEHWLEQVRALGQLAPRVVVVDWDWYSQSVGKRACSDERLWYLARMRLNMLGHALLADLIAEYVAAYLGLTRKVVAVDLDNTLWGGVVGEVGMQGLVLGEDGQGRAFQDFQRELLKLFDSGVLLTICSKNNAEDVWEVFAQHSGMVLRREHFAATRINWQDKATNLLEMSEELGLALDSWVFLDDNPVERDWIRSALPAVVVPDLPHDSSYRPQLIRSMPYFRKLQLTQADTVRSQSYMAQTQRRQFQQQFTSLDSYLASLEQEVTIAPVTRGSIARAAQMCQRTNQFNLTTKRYTLVDLERIIADPRQDAYTVAVKDRFGDSELSGLAIVVFADDTLVIDTLLLSCRVLGRKIEDVLLAFLVRQAQRRGAAYLIGSYIPTEKNRQTADFYSAHGFEPLGDGLFRLELSHEPAWASVDQIAQIAKVMSNV